MSELTEQFDADVAAVETDLPVTIRIDGKTYTAQRTPIIDRQTMVDAGFDQTFDFQIVVRTAAFAPGNPPPVNSDIEVEVGGEFVEYHIESATPAQDGVTVTYGIRENT